MLKQSQPGRIRRGSGSALMLAVMLLGAGGAWAASGGTVAANSAGSRYTLKLAVAVDGQARWLHESACLKSGENYTFTAMAADKLPAWHGRFSVASIAGGLFEISGKLSGGSLDKPVTPRVRTRPGQMATITFGGTAARSGNPPTDYAIKIDLTASVGC